MPLIDSSQDEERAFDTVCRRLSGFADRIATEWVDGYLCALVAGPRALELDDILPRMTGDAFTRAFADPEDEAMARAVLQARLRVLVNHLDAQALLDNPEALRLRPMVALWDDAERAAAMREAGISAQDAALMQTGGLWAEGFFDALDDFADILAPPAEADALARAEYEDLLQQVRVLLLAPDAAALAVHAELYWKGALPAHEDLLDEACFAIQDLRLWWLDFGPRPQTRRVAPVPGRNDPCPCGSGLKYKKCHGQSA